MLPATALGQGIGKVFRGGRGARSAKEGMAVLGDVLVGVEGGVVAGDAKVFARAVGAHSAPTGKSVEVETTVSFRCWAVPELGKDGFGAWVCASLGTLGLGAAVGLTVSCLFRGMSLACFVRVVAR